MAISINTFKLYEYACDKNNKQILFCEKMFYELYPEFKIKIYNFFNENKDIYYFYHYKYKYNLIYSIQTFKANYPDFNYDFYKTYSNLNDLNEEERNILCVNTHKIEKRFIYLNIHTTIFFLINVI